MVNSPRYFHRRPDLAVADSGAVAAYLLFRLYASERVDVAASRA